MGIERLYADGIEAAYQRGLTNPTPPAGPDFRAFSMLGAGFSGIGAGLAEFGASALEGLNAASRSTIERENAAGTSSSDKVKAQLWKSLTDASAPTARQAAQSMMPDPQTAHTANQIVAGLTRFGTKAAASVVAAGPVVGAGILGAEETNTVYRDLTTRGIDSETALKVAAVQGVISAAGVVLPIAGKTVAGTVGLVAAGGPGSYVAQETLARDILKRSGYADEAAKHDPTDPLGLAISTLLPAGFGAVALRAARAPKAIPPIKTESGVRDAVQLTPAEQAASDAFERSAANLAELRQEIARTKDPKAKAALEAELAKQSAAAEAAGRDAVTAAAAHSPEVVDAARVRVLQETTVRSLPEEPEALPRLQEAIDAVAEGRRPELPAMISGPEREANFRAWFGDSKVVDEQGAPLVVYHGTGADIAAFDAARSRDAGVWLTPIPGAAEMYSGARDGSNLIPAYVTMRNPYEATVGESRPDALMRAVDGGHDGIIVRDTDGSISTLAVFRPEQIKSATGNSGRFDPNSASLTDPIDTIRPQETATDAPTPAQAPSPEAAAPARSAGADAPPGSADAGRPAAGVQAAVVAAKVAEGERAALDALAVDRPDLMVELPGVDGSMRLADAVEMIRKQQEVEASDAELLRVAVLCDLSP